MHYDFDHMTTRRGSGSVKWDRCPDTDIVPLWVADMDFEAPACIRQAMQRRLDHGIFGYNIVPEEAYEAIIRWCHKRHAWSPQREWLLYTTGLVPALNAIVWALQHRYGCAEPLPMMFHTPAYNCFFTAVTNNGARLVASPLRWKPETEYYTMDFAQMEQQIEAEGVRLFVLCNPHNPTGRVWNRDELCRLADICRRHDVIVVSDEIHCEFVDPALGRPYIPFATVAREYGLRWVTLCAASKAFNIAGLCFGYLVVEDPELRQWVQDGINGTETRDVSAFGIAALQGAYTPEGEEWLCQMLDYVYGNSRAFRSTMKEAFPNMPIAVQEGTYLAWVDVSSISTDTGALAQRLMDEAKVWVCPGDMYGRSGFLRINLATQRQRLAEGTHRLVQGLLNS